MIDDLLNDIASIETRTGEDSDGEREFNTAFTAKCRFERTTLYSRSPDAKEITTDASILFEPTTAIAEGDRITVIRKSETYIGTVENIEDYFDIAGSNTHKLALMKSA